MCDTPPTPATKATKTRFHAAQRLAFHLARLVMEYEIRSSDYSDQWTTMAEAKQVAGILRNRAIYMAGRTDCDVQLDLRERRRQHLDQGAGGEYPCLGMAPEINAASKLSTKFCT